MTDPIEHLADLLSKATVWVLICDGCPECNGTGEVWDNDGDDESRHDCDLCHGTGKDPSEDAPPITEIRKRGKKGEGT